MAETGKKKQPPNTVIIGRDKATGKLTGTFMPKAALHTHAADGSTKQRVMEGTVEIRDPLYNPETLYMPKSMDMYNRWIRHYYRTNELVGNCVDIHSTLPFSNPRYTGISDPQIQKFFDWTKDDVLNLYDWILGSALEHTMLGEQFSFATFNSTLGTFDSLTILNPDTLDIYPVNFGGLGAMRKYIVSMNVPLELRELYQRSMSDPRFREVFDALDPEIRNCVVSGRQIPIDTNNIFAMQRLVSPYEKRGTSIVVRVLKWLLYEDKLRTAQMATADGHITPIQLWQLGDTSMGYLPNDEDLQAFNEILAQAEHQDFFQLVTHAALKYSAIVPSTGMMDISAQFDKCKERILIGLYASDAWMGNDGPSYCHDENTEVLTEKGWRKYHEVEDDEKIVTFNQDTEEFEPQNFSERIVNKNYCGDMYEFDFFGGKGARVSANHRMMVWDGFDKPHTVKLAEDITGKDSFICLSDLFYRLPTKIDGIKREEVSGETIWCFTVPNHFFVTRRNGVVSIQGNSNSVVALKVLKGRYKVALSKYEMLINEMNRKIAIANGFRKRSKADLDHSVRTKAGSLIIPEIQWPNNLGLNENYDHVQILMQLADKHKISWQSVLEELGVDTQGEQDKLRKEMETPLGEEYYSKVVETLLNKAADIKEKGGKFGTGAPALPNAGGGGAAPAVETGKPNVRENPENMAIPTGGQEELNNL